jgi:hypothetical protein
MYSSPLPEDNDHDSESSLILTDELKRTLECYIEHTLDVEGEKYVLLLPIDAPIEIFAWQVDGDEEEVEATGLKPANLPIRDDEVDFLISCFPTAEF